MSEKFGKRSHEEWRALPSKVRGNSCGLLQCAHQTHNRAVQVFARPPQLFDLVDRMQHRGVVLAAELAADLRKRSGGELLDDIHRHPARKGDSPRVTADLDVVLPQIELPPDSFLDPVPRYTLFLPS